MVAETADLIKEIREDVPRKEKERKA